MGSPMSSGDSFGGEEAGGDPFGGEETDSPFTDDGNKNDKPFDDTPFDAGVEADEESSPEKFIQQLSGKLGQSLRKYTEEQGQPDFDLEKFAINSVLSATNSGEMDQNDQSDIIKKVKGSKTDDGANDGADEGNDGADEGNDEGNNEDDIDLSGIDMEESHNPNPHRKTVFQNGTLGVKNGGMEENKYLNLESSNKSGIFANKLNIKKMIKEMLTESPTITPTRTQPIVEPKRITRRNKPFNPKRIEETPNPNPKASIMGEEPIKYISHDVTRDMEKEISITFIANELTFEEPFVNTGELINDDDEHSKDYLYKTDILSNHKSYSIIGTLSGYLGYGGEFESFGSEKFPVIEED